MFDLASACPVDVEELLSMTSVTASSSSSLPPQPSDVRLRAGKAAPTLLLVDDDEDVRDAGATWLAEQGFDVATVPSGDLAIASIQSSVPDVIVLDLMMPGVNGWDVWDWLHVTRRDIPVVIWTATGLRTGAVGDAVIVQKGAPEDLLQAVRAALAGRK